MMINGYISDFITKERGLKQGCPLSMQLYSIYIEPLNEAVQNEKNIKALPIPGGGNHVSVQFADDMNLLLSEDTKLYTLFILLQKFNSATGSTINQGKAQGIIIGTPKTHGDPFIDNIKWQFKGIKILGIIFYDTILETQFENWKKVTSQIKKDLEKSKSRKLSLKGKILVINTTILAKAWHLATVIPITKIHLKKIKEYIFQYIWKSPTNNPITRQQVYQSKDKGGLNLISLREQQNALQLKFTKQIVTQNENAPWVKIARYWIGVDLYQINHEWGFLNNHDYPKYSHSWNTLSKGELALTLPPILRDIPRTPNERPSWYINIIENLKTFLISEVKWYTRFFYTKLLSRKYLEPLAYTSHWTHHGYTLNPIWCLTYYTHADGKSQDTHFKFLHRVIPSKVFVQKRYKGSTQVDIKCASCNKKESTEHIFSHCQQAKFIWNFVYPTIKAIIGSPFKIFDLFLNKFESNTSIDKKKMILTLIQISLHNIWKNRNHILYDKLDNNQVILKAKASIKLQFIQTYTQIYKTFDTANLDNFKKHFCHTPKVCTLNEDVLHIQLVHDGIG